MVVLSLLYDTAARASEIINLKIEDIHLEEKYIILTGKGKKQRIVPVMEQTIRLLKQYIDKFKISSGLLFQNANHKNLNENFIKDILKKYTGNINKNITPHTIRHSRAIHLLASGVPLIYIRDLLGHESIQTTEEYAKVLEKDKFEAIRKVSPDSTTDNFTD